jgi:hypothetical protein
MKKPDAKAGLRTFHEAGAFVSAMEGAAMPRFYLDSSDGKQVEPDLDGVNLENADEAFEMVVAAARRLLVNGVRRGEDRSSWAFHVRNEHGAALFTFRFEGAAIDPHYGRAWKRKAAR